MRQEILERMMDRVIFCLGFYSKKTIDFCRKCEDSSNSLEFLQEEMERITNTKL